MYAEDGAIRSRSPVYSNDLYLARIWAKQVTLPRTLASLKRCLSAVECLDSPPITLFASAKCDVTLEDTDIVSLTHDTGTPPDPVILFLKGFQESPRSRRLDINKPEAVLLPARGGNTPFKAEFCMHAQCYPLISANFGYSQCIIGYTLKMVLSRLKVLSNPQIAL
jgi:hypothetical protein